MKTMDECVHFLVDSDIPYAEAKANVKYLDKKLKVVKAQALLKIGSVDKRSVAEKQAIAEASPEHLEALEEYKNSVLDMEILGTQRETINIRVDIWRTKSADRRRGNI